MAILIRICLVALSTAALGGCLSSTGEKIEYRYQATSGVAKFVVMPFNNTLWQIEFSTTTEVGLGHLELNTVRTPKALRYVETKTSGTVDRKAGEIKGAAAGSVEAEITREQKESYVEYEETDADIAIHTIRNDDDYGTLKVVRVKDGMVLGGEVYVDIREPGEQITELLLRLRLIRKIAVGQST